MPDNEQSPVFELDLGEHGNRLVFTIPDELRQWADEERNKWQWLNEAGSPATDRIWSELNQFQSQLHTYYNEWNQNRTRLPEVNRHWNILAGGPPQIDRSIKGRLRGFVWRLIGPPLETQQQFNAALVDHLNRNLAAAEEVPQTLTKLLEAVRQRVGHGQLPDLSNAQVSQDIQRDLLTLQAADVAQAAFEYCAAAIEWERLRQTGHAFRDEDLAPKQRAYDAVRSFLDRPGSDLDEEDFHEVLNR